MEGEETLAKELLGSKEPKSSIVQANVGSKREVQRGWKKRIVQKKKLDGFERERIGGLGNLVSPTKKKTDKDITSTEENLRVGRRHLRNVGWEREDGQGKIRGRAKGTRGKEVNCPAESDGTT